MLITDRLTIDGKPRKTTEGFLVTEVRVARTGIQHYTGREADPQNENGMRDAASVAIYRDEAEVFSTDSMQSFSMVDITVDHPPEAVTADNWRRYSVGVTGEHIARDGEYIRIPMMLKDADAIRAVEAGKRELSVGYSTKLVWTKGITPDGLHYDAKQTIIRANIHIICCMRAKTQYVTNQENGKTQVIKLGLAPVQREDTEFEFTVAFGLNQNNVVDLIVKDRTGLFKNKTFIITEETGKQILGWLTDSAPQDVIPPVPAFDSDDYPSLVNQVKDGLQNVSLEKIPESMQEVAKEINATGFYKGRPLPIDKMKTLIGAINMGALAD